MNTARWSLVRRIFEELLDLPGAERDAHLLRAVGDDAELRRQVEVMLAADASPPVLTRLLEPELAAVGVDVRHTPSLEGARIGRYRLDALVASGGMGSVYRARQDEPARTVAIKTLRAGLHGTQATARFRFEAEVLARLTHPHIARIFEAGTWSEGRGDDTTHVPWIAMEFVEDASDLPTFARVHALDLDARLALFLQVCDAVRHGHERGVVHRDLKPGNILVGRDGEVKVIDFGVARAVGDEPASSAAPRTLAGQLVGTLQYMSPEQVGGDPAGVGTASDVYALGLLLFELLTGERAHELRGRSLPEAAAVIRETPVRALRSVDASLPDDLGWIVARALEKDGARRYGSVSELMADLERHRRHEPVLAGPPSTLYRASRFVRRHRVMVGASAIVLLAIVGGLVVAAVGLQRERAERARSEQVADFLRDGLQTVRASRDGGDARVVDLLDDMAAEVDARFPEPDLAQADVRRALGEAFGALGRNLDAERELRAVVAIHDERLPPDDPRRLDVRIKLARTLRGSPRVAEAAALLDDVLAELASRAPREAEADAEAAALRVSALVESSGVLGDLGRLDESLARARAAVDGLPASHASPELRTSALSRLGAAARTLDRIDEATAAYAKLLRVLVPDRLLAETETEADELAAGAARLRVGLDVVLARGEDDPRGRAERVALITHAFAFATFLMDRDRLELAEGLLRALLVPVREAWGPVHFETSVVEAALARCLSASAPDDPAPSPARLAEAAELLRTSLAAFDATLDPQHVDRLRRLDLLGRILWLQGDGEGAERAYAEAAERARALPDDSLTRALSLVHHGSILSELGRSDEAAPLVREGWRRLREVAGPRHAETRRAAEDLALVHLRAGDAAYDPREAATWLAEGAEFAAEALGESHARTLELLSDLSSRLIDLDDGEAALAVARRAWDAHAATPDADDELSALLLDRLGGALSAEGEDVASARAHQAMTAITARVHGRTPSDGLLDAGLGALLRGDPLDEASLAAHWDEVATLLRDVLADARRAWEADPGTAPALALEEAIARANNVVDTLRAAERTDDALVLLDELVEATRALLGPAHEHLAVISANLALCLRDAGRVADARRTADHALQIIRTRAGARSPATFPYLQLASELAEQDDDLEAAAALQREVCEVAERMFAADSDTLLDARRRQAELLERLQGDAGTLRPRP